MRLFPDEEKTPFLGYAIGEEYTFGPPPLPLQKSMLLVSIFSGSGGLPIAHCQHRAVEFIHSSVFSPCTSL